MVREATRSRGKSHRFLTEATSSRQTWQKDEAGKGRPAKAVSLNEASGDDLPVMLLI